MTDTIDWAHWRTFLAVVEAGSLSGAARALRLTQPTVGRHLDALEAAIGRPLFVRGAHGLAATEAALALVPEAQAMRLAADALARRASASPDEIAGSVRIAASHVVGSEILPRALAPLLSRHPRLAIEIASSNESADLLRLEADLAVRMVRPTQGALVARRLAEVPLGLFAHRDYLDRAGRPNALADLASHVLIGPDRDAAALAALPALGPLSRSDLRLRTDSEAAQIAAVRAGVGIGLVQGGIARRDAALEPVLPRAVALALEAWLVMPAHAGRASRVRLIADHLGRVLPGLLS